MSNQEKKLAKIAPLEVSGKGPVRLRISPIDNTTATVEIGIDYSQASAPLHQYDADYCDVARGRTGVVCVFGKLKPGDETLRTKIEIAFSVETFVRQVWRNSRGLHGTVRKVSEGQHLAPLSGLPDPDKVQCFRANTVFMAVLASESVLDFYYISPGDIHLAHNQKKPEIALEPVVRVVVSTPLLEEFLDRCEPLATQLEPQFAEE